MTREPKSLRTPDFLDFGEILDYRNYLSQCCHVLSCRDGRPIAVHFASLYRTATMRLKQVHILLLLIAFLISLVSSAQFPRRFGVGLDRKQPGRASSATKSRRKHARGGASVAAKTMTLGQKNLFKYVVTM